MEGLPTNTEQEGARLQMDLNNRTERVGKKKLHLQELLMQQIAFKNLISRNKRKRGADAPPPRPPTAPRAPRRRRRTSGSRCRSSS